MKAVIQANVFNQNGVVSVAPNASIAIRDPDSGALIQLYEDRDGNGNPGNPFLADSRGFFRVYADPGAYNIYVSTDYGSQTYLDVPCISYDALHVFGAFGNLSSAICNLPLLAPDDAIKLQGDLQYLCESDTTHIDRYGVLHKNAYYSGTPTDSTEFTVTDSGATFGDLSGYVVYLTDGTNVAYRWVDAATATKVLWRKPVAFTPTSYKLSRPRFEKDGLLVEGASTNLFTYSEDMTNPAWAKSGATTVTATKIIPGNGESSGNVNQKIGFVGGQKYTAWAAFEAAEHSVARIQVNGGAFNAAAALRCEYNLIDKTATILFDPTSGAATCGITAIPGTARYLCYVTFTPDLTTSVAVLFYDYSVGDGTSGLYCHYRQIEALPFASSYIPTTSAPVTRAYSTQELSWDGNVPVKDTEAAFLCDVKLHSQNQGNVAIWRVNGETYRMLMWRGTDFAAYNGGLLGTFTSLTDPTQKRVIGVVYYLDGAYGCFVDGVKTRVLGPSSPTGSVGNFLIGYGVGFTMFGHIKNLRIYDRALTDAEMKLA